ncbi:glycosyltransferase family 4 protein [Candidatus Nitronereus thalassa]|uniref:Glycosyltransferase family 4 protein n=1 Tax=Candidatus Nitronereus thalassa TaxID=3020898 RepID=A0ABU3K550_9BACT|nr:glycosyltransferase family 4 protein [Candidatus Nitronereus thalassa]MDT7041522.1 glycosyltransferase family 4 protein [Candidatus Nitronereus thalassa]
MDKKTILYVTWPLGFGGTEKHLKDLVLGLQSKDVTTYILSFTKAFYEKIFPKGTSPIVLSDDSPTVKGFFSYWIRFLRVKPSVIVFVNGQLGLFPWKAYLAARLSGAEQVLAIEHSIGDPLLRNGGLLSWKDKIAKKIGRRKIPGLLTSQTICVSHAVRNRLVDDYGYPRDKTKTIWNGIDLHYYGAITDQGLNLRKGLGIGPEEVILVCVSRLDRKKGIGILLDAINKVKRENVSLSCFLVGDGPAEKDLREKVEALDISKQVHFIGHKDDVRPFLQEADIFVLPSFKEGLPFSLLEAMAFGLPCIATDVGGNREAVIHGENGLIVPPGVVGELAKAIRTLVMDKEQRLKMGQNGKCRVRDNFDINQMLTKFRSLLVG